MRCLIFLIFVLVLIQLIVFSVLLYLYSCFKLNEFLFISKWINLAKFIYLLTFVVMCNIFGVICFLKGGFWMFQGPGVIIGMKTVKSKNDREFRLVTIGCPDTFSQIDAFVEDDFVLPNGVTGGKVCNVTLRLEKVGYKLTAVLVGVK